MASLHRHGPRRTGVAFSLLCVMGLAVLGGCAVNPNTGRSQLMALPAAQSAHANAGFAISTVAGMEPASTCAAGIAGSTSGNMPVPVCPGAEQIEKLSQQVERVGAELEVAASIIAPALFTRIGSFNIGVSTGIGGRTASSAGGRIVIAADLAALDPTDDVVAFLIAREMGHVIARHGEENSGVRMAASVLTTIVPIGGLIIKFAASVIGSYALTNNLGEPQRREADELALALLERCNRSAAVIAFNLRAGLRRDMLPASEWGTQFTQSIGRVNAMALARVPARAPTVAVANYVQHED